MERHLSIQLFQKLRAIYNKGNSDSALFYLRELPYRQLHQLALDNNINPYGSRKELIGRFEEQFRKEV